MAVHGKRKPVSGLPGETERKNAMKSDNTMETLKNALPTLSGTLAGSLIDMEQKKIPALIMETPVTIAGGSVQIAACTNGIYSFAWYEDAASLQNTASFLACATETGYYLITSIKPRKTGNNGWLPESDSLDLSTPAVHIMSPENNMTPASLFGDSDYKKRICAVTLTALHDILEKRHGKGILSEKEYEALLKR